MDDEAAAASVAIIGMAARVPGAASLDLLWQNLAEGRESISFFSRAELAAAGVRGEVLDRPGYVPARGVVAGADEFDAAFFGYGPRDAEIIDPQQRLFLECAWEALEHAGYDTARYPGHIGVFGGASMSTYLLNLLTSPHIAETVGGYRLMLANDKDHLTMRVAHKLDLRGPAVTVQTACSTSLVAVHVAVQALLDQQCDMALAGGVTVSLPQLSGYVSEEGGIFSPDGHCRPFDTEARGTVPGNGVGLVALKRLTDAVADRDTIHAVIRGSAVNNDGALKAGYTAPSGSGQAAVIAEALDVARVDPDTISYVEAHGTGTSLGDPIEITALARALGRPGTAAPCTIGSVKANLGHLDVASGIAGLIKTVLALSHQAIPPTPHFARPNEKTRLTESGFQVNTTLRPWPTGPRPRRAGVSSFGMGGTNAHVVLEEAPPVPAPRPGREPHVLVLSAASEAALEAATSRLAGHLAAAPDGALADAAFTLQVGRKVMPHRRALLCRTAEEAAEIARSRDPARFLAGTGTATRLPVVFMFPGQGAQRVGMGRALYAAESVFTEVIDQCAEVAGPMLGVGLRDLLYPAAGSADGGDAVAARLLQDTAFTQPALFAMEYALARTWISWGVAPAAMIGHSLGEYVAACLAGVISLGDALELIVARGRLVADSPPGSMLSVAATEAALLDLTGDEVGIAAVNAAGLTVLAGTGPAIDRCAADLAARRIATQRLHTSHAFHSPMMEALTGPFRELFSKVALHPPTLPYISNVTGTWITAEQATSPDYWAAQMRSTVRFSAGLSAVLTGPAGPERVLLEAGPGETMSKLARQHPEGRIAPVVTSLPAAAVGGEGLTAALARLWLSGAEIDWERYHAGAERRRVPLPGYPFERRRFWIDGEHAGQLSQPGEHPAPPAAHERPAQLTMPRIEPRTDLEAAVAEVWQDMLGIGAIGVADQFIDLGGHSLLATQIVARLREMFGVDLTIERFFVLETVAEVAAEIEDLLVAEIDGLSDEEVRRLSLAPSGPEGSGPGAWDRAQRAGTPPVPGG